MRWRIVQAQCRPWDLACSIGKPALRSNDPKTKSAGAWVFSNTRIPVKALFENLESGATIDQFLEWFPGVTREQAQAILEFAERTLVTS